MNARIDVAAAAWRANRVLLIWLVASGLGGFSPALGAAERYWSGFGAAHAWSNPFSWIPMGVPQDGDDLIFGGILNTDTLDTMVNDLPGLTVRSMTFRSEVEFFSETWILSGSELKVTGDITCEQDIDFNCGLTLGRSILIQAGRTSLRLEEPITLRFNGPLNLGEHNLTVLNRGPYPGSGVYRINSTISGQGNLRFVNENANQVALAVFAGDQANTLTGTLGLERRLDPSARPFQASFDKPGGNVVNSALYIGDGCEVTLRRADQIGDDAVVSITGGGRLQLNGFSETLGSLMLTNVHADADPTRVDGGGTLSLRGGITTSVFNEGGAVPTIRAVLELPSGPHVFNLNNTLAGPGLELQGRIVGAGGFSKFGNATFVLATSNAFHGPVSVNDGILDIQHDGALGSTASGLTITDGSVILRNVLIHDEALSVRGTRPVTANTSGSFLSSIGVSGWFGRIELDTNLVVNSTDLCILGGPIVGLGGFEFLGRRNQIVGDSSLTLGTYTGRVRSLCEVLTLSDPHALGNELIVGGGFSPLCEVRWTQDTAGFPRLTLHTNGLVNLNGHSFGFSTLDFHGGRITTGSGTLFSGQVTVHPTNAVATIDGTMSLESTGPTEFTVHDGPASPDLTVTASIEEIFKGSGLQKKGDGQMDLRGANSYTGPTLVDAGILGILHDSALGATSQGTTVSSGATVAFGAQVNTLLEPFTIAGSGVGGTAGALRTVADVFINTNLVLSGNSAIRTDGTNSRLQVNNISGTGPLTKLGGGRLVLRGNAHNTYTGDTLVTEGVLDLAKPSNINSIPGQLVIGTTPAGTAAPSATVEHRASFTIIGSVTVNGGGLWNLNGASQKWTPLDLQGRPALTLNDGGDVETGSGIFTLPVGGNIVVNPASQRFGNSTISGRVALDEGPHRISVARGNLGVFGGSECNVTASISELAGTAGLEKDGDGTLRFAGTNSYRGATLVTGGTLQIDGVHLQSITRVLDTGRLHGVGTLGSIELLGANATVLPGTSPTQLNPGTGILTCFNFNSGAVPSGVLFLKLNGTTPGTGHDQINARGTVRLTGLSLQGSLGVGSALGQRFIIINNDGTDSVQGTFEGLAENASVYLGGERFTISYTGGTGNDVLLTRQVTPQLTVTTLPAGEVPNFALDFDGRFSRVHVGTNPFPGIVNNFTIELWANPTASRLETAESTTGISDIGGQRHAVFPDHGDLGYGAGRAGAGISIGTNGLSVFEHAADHLPSLLVYSNAIFGWTHVALVYSNRQPRLYVNGTLVRSGPHSAKTFVHPSANLGGSIQGLTYGNFQGQLDEVRVWNGVLSQAQIQTNLNRSLNGAEAGLLVYFRCDETNGVPLMDSAPAAPNLSGTLLNGVASVLSGALPPTALNGPSVTLHGLASPGGIDASVWFEWGATTNYGNVTAAHSVSSLHRTAGFSETLAGLAAGTYQYRAAGSNGLHIRFGLNQSFTLLNGAPLLSIEKLAADQVLLLWPTNAVGFTLQSNPDLNPSHWLPAGPAPSVVDTNHVVVNSATESQQFYRLWHP